MKKKQISITRYWELRQRGSIGYRTDSEYEEHFRQVFRKAVHRRLQSDAPILAELSGGIDSSSIVCVADEIIQKEPNSAQLDTISFFDSQEASQDEREYFSVIETLRGRVGHHLDLSRFQRIFSFHQDPFVAVPRALDDRGGLREEFENVLRSGRYRIVLSGVGGDEFLGGVPNPFPQLGDLFLSLRFVEFFRQLGAWSLHKRVPALHMLYHALSEIRPTWFSSLFSRGKPEIPTWVNAELRRECRHQRRSLDLSRSQSFLPPSKREFVASLEGIKRQMAYFVPDSWSFEERRYPLLDQDLIEFLFAIPSNQLLRPGERRSLMRRALVGLVPHQILWRRTKGRASKSIITTFQNSWSDLQQLFDSPLTTKIGFLDRETFLVGMDNLRRGLSENLMDGLRIVYLELWLHRLADLGICGFSPAVTPVRQAGSFTAKTISLRAEASNS